MSELSEAVKQLRKAAAELEPFIQHTCDYRQTDSPYGDVCECYRGAAMIGMAKAMNRLQRLADMVSPFPALLWDDTFTVAGLTVPEILRMKAEQDGLRPRRGFNSDCPVVGCMIIGPHDHTGCGPTGVGTLDTP